MFHPNAYLRKVRNVQCGLKTRTRLLLLLEDQHCSTGELVNKTNLSYNVVLYHLRLMCREDIVAHKGRSRYVWVSTGFGQTRLI